MNIRRAKKSDMSGVMELIHELARYENAPDEVTISVNQLEEDGFGECSFFKCFVAEEGTEIVGMALYYYRYSTWKGKTIYLEDLVVKQDKRQKGIGSRLFETLAGEAKNMGAQRMEWQVLDWNEPAINFYKKYGAILDKEWVNCKFTRQQLTDKF